MTTNEVPTQAQIVERALKVVPVLKANAAWTEQNRRLHDESIEALADAGMFRLRVPVRYGGYEVDTRTLVEVGSILGQGDGSASWVASVYWIPGWMAGLFPDHVQDEVFSTPDVRVCGTLSPGGMATPTDGGVVLNGKWGFISGALHAQWQEIIAISPDADGNPAPIMALVPMSDLTIVDDWYTSGLCGTGSVTTVAENVLIPADRVLPLGAALTEQYASEINVQSPVWRAPLLGTASASAVGTVLGLAKAALEVFLERMPNRKITYTAYETQQEAPITHFQVAEASLKIDQVGFHANRVAELVDRKGETGEPWTLDERVRSRADVGAVCRLGKEAVDILAMGSGGSSIYSDIAIQRINRDIQAINVHALMAPTSNYELYGRVLCGLEPNTGYL